MLDQTHLHFIWVIILEMARTKREYILATCFLSGAAAIITLISLGTQNWIESDGEWLTYNLSRINKIRYGLFEGIYRQQEPSPATFELSMTCLLGENACALLCGLDEDARFTQLKKLINNEETNFDTNNCPQIINRYYTPFRQKSIRIDSNRKYDLKFINGGVWICTIIFLCLSAVAGLFSAGLAIYNTTTNPIEYYWSVYGLFIYNTIALFSIIITIMCWGIMFNVTTIHNVAIYYTIVQDMTTDGRAALGYSYWINFASICLYISSISVLYIREYLISKNPKINVHIDDNADPVLCLY